MKEAELMHLNTQLISLIRDFMFFFQKSEVNLFSLWVIVDMQLK